jgi:ATP-binding cassette subfamily B protein/ATP-binding cassette subfamily C protein
MTAVAVIAPLLVPFLLIASVPTGVMAVRMARRQYIATLAGTTRRRRRWMLAVLMANRYTAAEVRTFQMRDALLEEYRDTMGIETGVELRVVAEQTRTRLAGVTLSGLASAGLYVVLWSLVTGSQIPLAAAATALIAMQTAHLGLNSAVFASNSLYESALYWGDYRTFLDRSRDRTRTDGGGTVDRFDEITLTDVSLRYPDSDSDAVTGVTMTIRRGQVIALVGENGSGKSSLAKIVSGLYQPTTGTMSWNGGDTTQLSADDLAAQVCVMSQDWWKFPFTAGRNITLGRPRQAPDTDRMRAAATASTAHDAIRQLPRGYDTLLSREFRDGHDLSGGQWQRLVAARAFYRDAPLMICDEPSAALDARAEHAMFQQLGRRPDRTVVLITHRLSNVRHADCIYVLDQGRIVASGDHDTLIAEGGMYAELWDLQASSYTE